MKFIHTADWHLGNKMHEIDRTTEFESFLKWLKSEIEREEAIALVIAGDVFDTANPPTESRRQYLDFLASLLDTCCRNIIIIGGNHDSGSLLDSEKSIFNALNIHVIGSVANLLPEQMAFEIKDKNGNACGICAAVPFAREIELRNYCDSETQEGSFSDMAYSAIYSKVLKAAKMIDKGRNLPLIATGHLYAADLEGRFESITEEADCADGRRKIDVVGKLGSVHAGIFPKEFDYVALGHIHYATKVGKNPRIRYSGSPFVLGFDEANLPRHILSVQADKDMPVQVNKINVPQTNIFKRISGNCKTIKEELSKYTDVQASPVYIELYYKKEEGVNLQDELESIIGSLEKYNVFVVSRRLQRFDDFHLDVNIQLDSQEVKNLLPEDIFKALILSKFPENLSDLDQENKEKRQQEIIQKYMPFFMAAYSEVENNEKGESL